MEIQQKQKVLEHIKLEVDPKKEKKVPICNVCSKTLRDNYNLKKHVQQKICQRSQIKCEHSRKQFFKDLEETSHMNKGTCLECQQKGMQVKNSTHARFVKKYFIQNQNFKVMQKFMWERNLILVQSVANYSHQRTILCHTREVMEIKKVTSAQNVKKFSKGKDFSGIIQRSRIVIKVLVVLNTMKGLRQFG